MRSNKSVVSKGELLEGLIVVEKGLIVGENKEFADGAVLNLEGLLYFAKAKEELKTASTTVFWHLKRVDLHYLMMESDRLTPKKNEKV